MKVPAFKSSKATRYASYALIVLFVLYALSAIGMTGLLFSAAVALVTFGLTESLEATTVILVLTGVLYKTMRGGGREGFQATGVADIRKRVEGMKKVAGAQEPTGVLSSSFAEGFENAKMPEDEGFETASGEKVTADLVGALQNAISAAQSAPAPAPAAPAEEKKTEAFRGGDQKGLFKLGEIPTDEKGGFHLDQGTTVLNALNALKPDQVKAMTEDTQKLIETQKSLMGMLGTMKPMLTDGKQLLETFNTMFAK